MDETNYSLLIEESRLRIKAKDDAIEETIVIKKRKLDMLMELTKEIASMEDNINYIQQSIKAEIDIVEDLKQTHLSVRMSELENRLSAIERGLVYDSTI